MASQARDKKELLTDLHSFLDKPQSCMGFPSTHVQDCCVVQELSREGVQPIRLLLLCSILYPGVQISNPHCTSASGRPLRNNEAIENRSAPAWSWMPCYSPVISPRPNHCGDSIASWQPVYMLGLEAAFRDVMG